LSITKTLAKICSKKDKPDGFTAVPGIRLHLFLPEVPLIEVCGFGPNTAALLEKKGMKTAFDYVSKPAAFAERLLGKTGVELWRELRGECVYDVVNEKKEKYLSISKTKTFSPPSSDREFVKGQVMRNLESAFIKLRRHDLSAKRLAIYLRTQGYRSCGIEGRINRHSSSTLDFTRVASVLFDRLFEKDASYRATGVILSDITCE
jgi:nucleotidyltransferase/DNA polymerase involved in DNA repair